MNRRLLCLMIAGFALFAEEEERIFRFVHPQTSLAVQEISTVIRSIGEIRQAFANSDTRTLTIQGSREQIALTEWMVHQMDRPAASESGTASGTFEIRQSDGSHHQVRVFYLPATFDEMAAQELTTLVRSIGEIRHTFVYRSARMVAVRGTPGQLAVAEWLLQEVPNSDALSAAREFQLDPHGEGSVQVFHLSETSTVEQLQEMTKAVRQASGLRRVFTFNAARAIAVRGTAEQVNAAARLLAAHPR